MQIKSIDIKGLFGTFDYKFELPEDNQPFIVTGLNGYGKTTILNIIYSLASCELYYFFLLPFENISISFTDGQSVKIEKIPTQAMEEMTEEEDIPEGNNQDVQFTLFADGKRKGSIELREADIPERLNMAAAMRGEIFDFGVHGIRTKEFHEFLKSKKYLYESLLRSHGAGGKALLVTLNSLTVCFLDDNRLMQPVADTKSSNPGSRLRNTVIGVSDGIKAQLQKSNTEYVNKAQEIEGSMMAQLLQAHEALDKEEYDRRKKCLDEKIQELKECGMIAPAGIFPYDKKYAGLLSVFLKNQERKVEAYEKMLGKINLFSKLLKKLKLINKTITLSQQHGIIVTAANGDNINLVDLSSGEQNELIMLYALIFLMPDNSIFLIDEPEDSMHIEWQADFLDNVEEIAKTKNLQTIVVTHSPQIIGGRWKNCYDLTEVTSQK